MNNASKVLLFRATFLVYFISSVYGKIAKKAKEKIGVQKERKRQQ